MANSELKCLRCGENINVSIERERFSVFCIANGRCEEKEDQNLEEESFRGRGFSKKQFEIIIKLMKITLIAPLREL